MNGKLSIDQIIWLSWIFEHDHQQAADAAGFADVATLAAYINGEHPELSHYLFNPIPIRYATDIFELIRVRSFWMNRMHRASTALDRGDVAAITDVFDEYKNTVCQGLAHNIWKDREDNND